MKTRLLVLVLAVCMIATPAMADLFGFEAGNLESTYVSGTGAFTSVDWASSTANLYRNDPAPTQTALFNPGSWGSPEAFTLQMTISGITATGAVGTGDLTFYDTDGDNISADFTGTWLNVGGTPVFSGMLSEVYYNQVTNTTFDGHSGDSVSMVFTASQPWFGTIMELAPASSWFTAGDFTDVHSGSVDAHVVPLPAAVLLGILGLGVAGLKLRKYA